MARETRPVYKWERYFARARLWALTDTAPSYRCLLTLRKLFTHDFRSCTRCLCLYHYSGFVFKCTHCLEEESLGP